MSTLRIDNPRIKLLILSKNPCTFVLLASLLSVFIPIKANEINDLQIELGKQLYFDNNLSFNRTQSCATCHDPNHGFVDKQNTKFKGAVSLGDDGKSFGDRSAPTASYANQIPSFHLHTDGHYIGGQFWDGREKDLIGQAGGPPLNSMEMGMPSKEFVLKRLKENNSYSINFKKVYGNDVFDSPESAYKALTKSIASFEETDFFSPFNSKYDRYLTGNYKLSEQEDLGMTLFFSEQFTNCNQCHQLKSLPATEKETFSKYTYHNIGIPVNKAVREHNQTPNEYRDLGLFNHPLVTETSNIGKFKVPTLRNVAVTAPYMHNGIFEKLETVVAFYNKYNSKSKKNQINPETNKIWDEPEVEENISLTELEFGPALDSKRINALVAFMKLLTDQRFEYLIDPN
jgi:cytochrome c peroxidase